MSTKFRSPLRGGIIRGEIRRECTTNGGTTSGESSNCTVVKGARSRVKESQGRELNNVITVGRGRGRSRGGARQVVVAKGVESLPNQNSNKAPTFTKGKEPSTTKVAKSKNQYRRIRCEFIGGKKWYPFLINKGNRKPYQCLLDDLGYNSNHLYVRLTTNNYFMFSSFRDALELRNYIEPFHAEKRCFDEIIMEGPQKPRFDIDLEDEQLTTQELDNRIQMIINQVLDGIMMYLPNINLQKNIRLFTSHGGQKRSVHIVVDGFFHDTYLDAKGFYDDVIKHVSPSLSKYVDHGIYGKKKQLRIMNCCKWKSDRIKTLQETFRYHQDMVVCEWGELDNEVIRFISSLITVIAGCDRLPSFAKKSAYVKSEDLPDGIVNDAIELTKDILGKRYTFKYESTTGSIVVLIREAPSMCITCDRIHEKQHPYLHIFRDNVYFNCRRHPQNKSTFIGNLSAREVRTELVHTEKIVVTVTDTEKIVKVGDGGTFTFRKKNGVIEAPVTLGESNSGESSSRTLTRIEPPGKMVQRSPARTFDEPPMTDRSTIMNRLRNLDSNKTHKPRLLNKDKIGYISAEIDFNNIDFSK